MDSASVTASPTSVSFADVLSVTTTGQDNAYQLTVTLQSPDTGCDQYADWWEVVSETGELIHRRVLLHSHVNEQPFTRSSGPVAIATNQIIIIRAHMHPQGYGGQTLQGSISDGFAVTDLAENFGVELAQQHPLPTGCQF